MDYAVDDFPADCGWVFCVVLNVMRWVVVHPIWCDYFNIDDYAKRGVWFNDGNGSFAHAKYSIQM